MHNKSAVAIFPSLSDPMRGISRNKESFSVEFLEEKALGPRILRSEI